MTSSIATFSLRHTTDLPRLVEEKPKNVSQLESLPNEIFYKIFSYLNRYEACSVFRDLNSRFFNLISTPYFDQMCLKAEYQWSKQHISRQLNLWEKKFGLKDADIPPIPNELLRALSRPSPLSPSTPVFKEASLLLVPSQFKDIQPYLNDIQMFGDHKQRFEQLKNSFLNINPELVKLDNTFFTLVILLLGMGISITSCCEILYPHDNSLQRTNRWRSVPRPLACLTAFLASNHSLDLAQHNSPSTSHQKHYWILFFKKHLMENLQELNHDLKKEGFSYLYERPTILELIVFGLVNYYDLLTDLIAVDEKHFKSKHPSKTYDPTNLCLTNPHFKVVENKVHMLCRQKLMLHDILGFIIKDNFIYSKNLDWNEFLSSLAVIKADTP